MSAFGVATTAAEVLSGVDISGRRVLVTGGGSGIGLVTALALAEAGAKVSIAVRDPRAAMSAVRGRATGSTGAALEVLELDLTDPLSVVQLVDGWSGRLDALVANAGVMDTPLSRTAQGWELQLATNHLGHFFLARGLRSALAEAGGRVVSVSSRAHLQGAVDLDDPHFGRRAYARRAAYAQSKSANVLCAVAGASKWGPDGITINSLMPGAIHTRLQRHMDDETRRRVGMVEADTGHGVAVPAGWKTPEQGAATSVLLAVSPTVAGVSGRYYEDCVEAAVVPGGGPAAGGVASHALDPETADRLWEMSLAHERAVMPTGWLTRS